ncbi:MAG TPA: hypothetical protein VF049_22275 [Nocardioidaceae bacterium]
MTKPIRTIPETPTSRDALGPGMVMPALAVDCPRCGSAAGELCMSHGGTRVCRSHVHQARTTAWRNKPGADL